MQQHKFEIPIAQHHGKESNKKLVFMHNELKKEK
jgi:hypothetical protein